MLVYTPNKAASGTSADLIALQAAAFVGFVFRMRRHGRKLAARHVADPVAGQVVLIDRYGETDRVYVRLYHPGQFTDWSDELHGARVVKERGGCVQLTGDEWIASAGEHRLQTWLCTPTVERGREILRRMEAVEKRLS